jgi:hypothetical protein
MAHSNGFSTVAVSFLGLMISTVCFKAQAVPPAPEELNLATPVVAKAIKPLPLVRRGVYKTLVSVACTGVANGLPSTDNRATIRIELKRLALRKATTAEVHETAAQIVDEARTCRPFQ